MFHEGINRYFSTLMWCFLMLARVQELKHFRNLEPFLLRQRCIYIIYLFFKQELKELIKNKWDNIISHPEQHQTRECQHVGGSPGSIRRIQRPWWLSRSVQPLRLGTNLLISFFIEKVGNIRLKLNYLGSNSSCRQEGKQYFSFSTTKQRTGRMKQREIMRQCQNHKGKCW